MAGRVSQAGAHFDGAGIAISTTASYQAQPAIAFDGANYLVWSDRSGPSSTAAPAAQAWGNARNPGNGFATGCIAWTAVTACTALGRAAVPD